MFSASWYTQHPQEVVEETDPSVFENMNRSEFASVVNRTAMSNTDREADALSKADSWSFQVANPWFLRTEKNTKLVNHWLKTQGIENPLYPDFAAGVDFLAGQGMLDVDDAEIARQADQRGNRTFKGTLTGIEFGTLDEMISQERQAALRQMPEPTKEEIAFNRLPIEQQKAFLREGERGERVEANAPQTRINADAFLTLHPEIVDSERNAHLIKMQLVANGITDNNVSIPDYEKATNQLRESGLLTLNKAALNKQHAAEVARLASEAAQTPGSVFDTTSEEEMYALPMEELRKRARG
jgi:hypothetical protein